MSCPSWGCGANGFAACHVDCALNLVEASRVICSVLPAMDGQQLQVPPQSQASARCLPTPRCLVGGYNNSGVPLIPSPTSCRVARRHRKVLISQGATSPRRVRRVSVLCRAGWGQPKTHVQILPPVLPVALASKSAMRVHRTYSCDILPKLQGCSDGISNSSRRAGVR